MTDENLNPPRLDETLVKQLADLASEIDGCHESLADELINKFNSLADTKLTHSDFQGIYGAEEHENYVRRLLTEKSTGANPELGKSELTEMFKRVLQDPTDDAYLAFVFSTIQKTFGDNQVSDLVFWPGIYFGDGDNGRDLTPEEMADAVLERFQKK